jgi:hypothetical protein
MLMYEMINQLLTTMPKALGYPWEGGLAPDERPLRLLDALGRDLRIPTVFLSSRQASAARITDYHIAANIFMDIS